jgi:ubiquinone/menaquinone biosynthesis C-methylase UbiE
MNQYNQLAIFYNQGGYGGYSTRMAEFLPLIWKKLNIRPKSLLDIACGEGTFAMMMAKQGFSITGLDLSRVMIKLARQKAKAGKGSARFMVGDMRKMKFKNKFDIATCWFDSLNYLLREGDLLAAFRGVFRALKSKGYFIFDMNTIRGIAYDYWQLSPYRCDTDDLLMLHRFTDFDEDRRIMTMKLTSFERQGKLWRRWDEIHQERGYTQREITKLLQKAGFRLAGCWGSLINFGPPRIDSPRLWWAAQKM